MKKFAAIGLVFILCVGMLTGCGMNYNVSDSTIFVLKNGKVVTTDVESFDEDTYDKTELEEYVKDEISTYTSDNGKGTVKMKGLTLKENVATLILQYKSATDYSSFNGMELFAGTMAEALAAGYTFDADFAEINKGKLTGTAELSQFKDDDKLKVVVVKANTNVQVDGTILYVSTQNVSLVDKSTVSIRNGNNLLDESDSEAVTESSQETEEIVSETSEETTSGSVDEDDLVVGTEESSEVTFDFQKENTSNTTEFSNVFTYIIYK